MNADAFLPNADLPDRHQVLTDRALSGAQRTLAEAVFDHDADSARRLIAHDPALLRSPHDGAALVMTAIVASGDPALLDWALRYHGTPDPAGDGAPLVLALKASTTDLARRLLAGGAPAAPLHAPLAAYRVAIAMNDPDRVALLLDAGGDPNVTDGDGRRPLHLALNMDCFRIAALLIDRGADPWAIDVGGANLGSAVTTPLVIDDPAEAEAQDLLSRRAAATGWPVPVPTTHEVCERALKGDWPPAAARARGAGPVDPAIVAGIAARMRGPAAQQ